MEIFKARGQYVDTLWVYFPDWRCDNEWDARHPVNSICRNAIHVPFLAEGI